MIKIILADDHKIITEGIANLLKKEADIKIEAIFHDGLSLMDYLPHHPVDLILLDIDMPMLNGIECAEKILKRNPDQKIAMLTMHGEKALIIRLIEMGVKGYFIKTIEQDELILAIRKICAGNEYFPADVTKALLTQKETVNDVTINPLVNELSARETEIIKLVAQGMSNKEIGESLFISHRTVDTHRTNLMKKLNIHNIAGLIRFAFQNKLVE
ncbi:MAG: response regulator transcription factor [Bacteroidota bacterium]